MDKVLTDISVLTDQNSPQVPRTGVKITADEDYTLEPALGGADLGQDQNILPTPPRNRSRGSEALQKIAEREPRQILDSLNRIGIDGANLKSWRNRNAVRTALRETFWSQLRYEGMEDRSGSVAEAHESTFRWVFEDPEHGARKRWSNFRLWLESDDQLYWITGKPGSGKSTLMKFIFQAARGPEARCMQHLSRRANGESLIVANFYFWAAGSGLQASKEGLYRTLLHPILQQCPAALIGQFFPDRWQALALFNEDSKPFSEHEVQTKFSQIIPHLTRTAKLCLFIGGLDEFDGNQDDLFKLFSAMIRENPIKADSNFASLQARESGFADGLFDSVVFKASGVFLWGYLVVDSLLDGMKAGDCISDFHRRLDTLPRDLEDLYERILNDLDAFFLKHAVQLFQLMAACDNPPLALLFSIADEWIPASGYHSYDPIVSWTTENIILRIDTLRRRLHSRCKGLLEIPHASSSEGSDDVRTFFQGPNCAVPPQNAERFHHHPKNPG
ncbi:hypothetical protein QBC35DRAFT_532472 [Podospora australis]|uniref:NACHT domain-containing protein n=1 Tax=Podospora australis TaxID=1536484 RepID=A0AAN6WW37_9PEZI|nr:hypothetical protein QBC35DRAFT_532472 [Podospora australis]